MNCQWLMIMAGGKGRECSYNGEEREDGMGADGGREAARTHDDFLWQLPGSSPPVLSHTFFWWWPG